MIRLAACPATEAAGVRQAGTTDINTNRRIDMGNPMNDLWRAQQDAATRMAEGWSTLLQPAADRTARPPAPSEITDGDTVEEVVEEVEPGPSAADALEAIQALGDGQRDFAGHMARWAEQQRDLADAMTAWAGRQRDAADALDRVLAAFSPATLARPL
jgi:hypothetical protein